MRKLLLTACAVATFLPSNSKASFLLEKKDTIITKITYNPSQFNAYLAEHFDPEIAALISRHLKGENIPGVKADETIDGHLIIEEEEYPEYPGQKYPNEQADFLLEKTYKALGLDDDISDLPIIQLQNIANFVVTEDKETAQEIYELMKLDLSKKESYIEKGELHRIKLNEIENSKNLLAYLESALSK